MVTTYMNQIQYIELKKIFSKYRHCKYNHM